MSVQIKNVVCIGGSGVVGKPVLEALLAAKIFRITVLSHKDQEIDYEDAEALVEAFRGQDAVVTTITTGSLGLQTKIIDAASKAGVKRFIPSDFGTDIDDDKAIEMVPIWQIKRDTIELLKSYEEKGLSWTAVINGLFFDWGLHVGFLGVDLETKSCTIYDADAPAAFTASTLAQIGQGVVGVLKNPEGTANRRVFISSFTITLQDLHSALERVTGQSWKTVNASTYDLEKEGRAAYNSGPQFNVAKGLVQVIQVALFRRGFGLDYGLHKNDNKLLGLEEEDLDTVLKGILA